MYGALFVVWVCVLFLCFFFFFKQKTAYEMRISDWSSDVCSSDLFMLFGHRQLRMLTMSHIVMVGGMLLFGFLGGFAGDFIGAVTGAMAGVVASAAVLLFLTDKPWTEVDRDAPQFGRSIWLVSLTLLVLAGQLYMAAAGIFPLGSEEHTSELQSLMRISYSVFCLKKNKKKTVKMQH